MSSSSPGTMMEATNSSRSTWTRVSSFPSPRWNASHAATRALVVLATEGGLSLRLQHDESGAQKRPPKSGASLVRSGYSRADAERLARALSERHERKQSRSHAPSLFKDVPVIYGFSSVAPLGPTAASFLGRYFQSAELGRSAAAVQAPAAQSVFRSLIGCRQRVERPGPTDGVPAGRLPLFRRSIIARAEARFCPSAPRPRDGGRCACSWTASSNILRRLARRPASACGFASAREDRTR